MVTPGIPIAYFAALSVSSFPLIPMSAGTLHNLNFYLVLEVLLEHHISGLVLGDLFYCIQWTT